MTTCNITNLREFKDLTNFSSTKYFFFINWFKNTLNSIFHIFNNFINNII